MAVPVKGSEILAGRREFEPWPRTPSRPFVTSLAYYRRYLTEASRTVHSFCLHFSPVTTS